MKFFKQKEYTVIGNEMDYEAAWIMIELTTSIADTARINETINGMVASQKLTDMEEVKEMREELYEKSYDMFQYERSEGRLR